tara:strand:+ start:284 stop:541 length:258 start_codon:yes stop_codon:yes gene_type:complete
MNENEFILRLIEKRPLCFFGKGDRSLLRDGSTPGSNGWLAINTAQAEAPLTLRDYLSYDEMQISAMVSVMGKTYFINPGGRNNQG